MKSVKQILKKSHKSYVFGQLCCVVVLFLFFQSCTVKQDSNLKPYINFLEKQNTSAKDYIIELFDEYDIVILCERDHREITQYDLILDVLSDNRFTTNVQNAYFEIGNENLNDTLNRFLHNRELSIEEVNSSVLNFQRNIYGAPLWEKSNYSYYIKKVHDINKRLPAENQVNIFGLDIGIADWTTATEKDICVRDSLVTNFRDSILASNFIKTFNKQHKTSKALVVLNFRHAFVEDLFGKENAGRFIASAFPSKVANVYLNSFAMQRNKETNAVEITAIADGKWDASFIKTNKNNVGFDFKGNPFGNDSLDIFPAKSDYTFDKVFTGFVYFTYFSDFRTITGIENFIDNDFAPELMKRYRLEQKVYKNTIPDINKLKEDYNTVTNITYKEDKDFGKALNQIEKWLK
jgi:hypothetical protein